ncbi:AIPR family protein [Tumebacillus flagellatus]|uniref:Abortive phage infection protein C-terminal domain-containing protein n=1 Tax=Tumebacillus flagellatus TaxID=1157490 RepID=A0A074LR43_9BACL|nr:AIPR family protein [Tumebacillus flagellatus]KEO83559.1 hypothetical protein EL26_09095 [Tumebacillus flagellatus]
MSCEFTYLKDFEARDDLNEYGDDALLLFALLMRYRIEDIYSVASDALVDGGNDKGCDLVYINQENGHVVIAQGYFCKKERLPEAAPENKAKILNTAISWLFARPIDELPKNIRPTATALRDAILSDQIKSIKIWYVHNLNESKNVMEELKTVEHTALNALHKNFPGSEIEIEAEEVGNKTLEDWYTDLVANILVTDSFSIEVPGGYRLDKTSWSAFVTAVPAQWLHEIYSTYKDKLFSANVREYLGSRRSDKNINHRIKTTASSNPENFWVYNNGLTVLVHSFDNLRNENGKSFLDITGISIVNGAQTTGSLGSLTKAPSSEVMVPVRFVMCKNADTIQGIIKYNNSQNKVEASDFRSNDAIQRRLREEFEKIPNATYLGGRRGNNDDAIRRPQNLIPSDSVAMALTAFHGDPIVAYNQKSKIWMENNLYQNVFNDSTTAEHAVFVYSLLRSIENKKKNLIARNNAGLLKDTEKQHLEFLRYRGSAYLLLYAISYCLEVVLNKPVPNKFRLSFGTKVPPETAVKHWDLVVSFTLPFANKLKVAVENSLKNRETVRKATVDFRSMVEVIATATPDIFENFAKKVQG